MIAFLRRRAMRPGAHLWPLVSAPTIWAVHFLFCYLTAATVCAKCGTVAALSDVRLAIFVATAIALLAVLSFGYIAWLQYRDGREGPPPYDEASDDHRHRFLAYSKLLLAALSFVSIVFTTIPAAIFTDCG